MYKATRRVLAGDGQPITLPAAAGLHFAKSFSLLSLAFIVFTTPFLGCGFDIESSTGAAVYDDGDNDSRERVWLENDQLAHQAAREFAHGDYQQAADTYAKIIEKTPGHIEFTVDRAACLMRLPSTQAKANAISLLESVLEENGSHERAHFCRGLLLYDEGRFTEALGHFAECRETSPLDPYVHYYQGQCWYDLGDDPAAVKAFERASKIEPSFAEALYGRYRVYLRTSQSNKANSALDAYRQASSQQSASQINSAREQSPFLGTLSFPYHVQVDQSLAKGLELKSDENWNSSLPISPVRLSN